MPEPIPGENPAAEENQFVPEEEMSEEDRKALQENEDFILNFKDEDLEDEEKKGKLEKILEDRKLLATTIAQKRHYRGKVKPEKTPVAAAPAAAPAAGQEKEADDTSTVLTFRLDHPELSKDVAKEIVDFARAHKISPEEALKKPVIKSYIASAKKEEDVEDATPGPSKGGRGSGPAAKDWSKASQAEVEAERARIQSQGS